MAQARQRSVELRAVEYADDATAVEKECLSAIYAYEEALSAKNGRRTRASRAWQMVKRHGILAAAERAVLRDAPTQGYRTLVEMGLQDYAFEAIVLRYQDAFSDEAVEMSERRMREWLED